MYRLRQNEPTPTLASSPSWIEPFSVLEFGVKCFFMCVAHQVGLPLSFGIWVDLLHLCLTFKSNGDAPLSLFPWWGTNYVTWCCLGWFRLHRERFRFSYFAWANTCFFVTLHLVFWLASWHHVIAWWNLHLD
jgi:hypothetical protein